VEHLSSPPVFSGDRVAQSLVFRVIFCGSVIVACPFHNYIFTQGLSDTDVVSSNLNQDEVYNIMS
jgi:hypothetical protein